MLVHSLENALIAESTYLHYVLRLKLKPLLDLICRLICTIILSTVYLEWLNEYSQKLEPQVFH